MIRRRRHNSGKQPKSKQEEEEEEDILLKQLGNGKLVSWRPRRPIPASTEVVPFHRIARVVHLDEALDIQEEGRMMPRPITDFSAFHPNGLAEDHPCRNLQVL